MADDTTTEERIDLRPDDATLDEIEQETDDETGVEPAETPDLEKQAREQAIRYRDGADGQTKEEILENAAEKAQTDMLRARQIVSKWESTIDDSRKRIDRLEATKERVQAQPDELPVLQTLAGGITLEVPGEAEDTYDRADLCDEIDETVEALEGQIDDLEQRTGVTKRSAEKAELAGQMLLELLKKERQKAKALDDIDW